MFLSLRRNPSSPLMIESLKRLPDQIRLALHDSRTLNFPQTASIINNIVINGMGGSNLGGYIAKAIFNRGIKIPIIVEPGYTVPSYVNDKTLYIISSYSGTTEEPQVAYKTAKRQRAIVVVITSDNDNPLKRLAEKEKLPAFLFSPTANPSGQPRLGLGYGLASLLAVFKKFGIITLADREVKEIINQLKRRNNFYLKPNNEVERLAKKLTGHEALLISGQIFSGNVRTMRNQWCETAKNFASYLTLSDMNHFALEGLAYPNDIKKRLIALCIESDFYETKIKRRLELTKEVMKKNKLEVLSYHPTGKTILAQSFDLVQCGSWLTYYLSLHNHVNPLEVPWVDWFKQQLFTK